MACRVGRVTAGGRSVCLHHAAAEGGPHDEAGGGKGPAPLHPTTIFISGLSRKLEGEAAAQAEEQRLTEALKEQFGWEVEAVNVTIDKKTGKAKG